MKARGSLNLSPAILNRTLKPKNPKPLSPKTQNLQEPHPKAFDSKAHIVQPSSIAKDEATIQRPDSFDFFMFSGLWKGPQRFVYRRCGVSCRVLPGHCKFCVCCWVGVSSIWGASADDPSRTFSKKHPTQFRVYGFPCCRLAALIVFDLDHSGCGSAGGGLRSLEIRISVFFRSGLLRLGILLLVCC